MRVDYHRKIVARLRSGELRPKTFEACACDLLRDVFPGLVPIPGGNDAGMDGAIPDGLAEAFPLACTTAQDVSRNLRASLESYVSHGGHRRKVALATSQALTRTMRDNLGERARERGFKLVQIFDQASIANRLYHSPRWCRDLLNLPARLSALASVPNTRRPFFETELIGRDKDLAWLRETSGDRILAGQPGAGKTYLLYKYSQEVDALFLESSDEEAVAAALLEHEPGIVIVDDAHVHQERLELLRRRRRAGHDFSILATTWPGDVEQVSHALETLPEGQIRTLELLTRNELVEVYRQAKIVEEDVGPDLLRDLVTQASKKPGLALTLATLCHQGAWPEVLRGETLRKNLMPIFEKLVGEDAVEILASFSLGGKDGFTMEQVAEFLELRLTEMRRKAVRMAAGGVLSETGDRYSVEPSKLRSVLLAEVFFSGTAADLPWRTLMMDPEEDSRSFRSTVEAIVLARHHGAQMDRGELQDLVARADSQDAWQGFTALDSQAAQWVLERYPHDIADIARAALSEAPRSTIQNLLQKASSVQTTTPGSENRLLRVLTDWLQTMRIYGVDLSAEQRIAQRKWIIEEVRDYLSQGGEPQIGQEALIACLSPRLDSSSTDPGFGSEVTFYASFLSLTAVQRMEEVWREMVPLLDLEVLPWGVLNSRLTAWVDLTKGGGAVPVDPAVCGAARAFTQRILRDLATQSSGSPGLAAALADLGNSIDLKLDVDRDPDFDALYPSARSRVDVDEESDLEALITRLKALSAEDMAQRLKLLHREAKRIHRPTAWREVLFARSLAATVDQPESWLRVLFEARVSPQLLSPLLEQVVKHKRPHWDVWLNRFLDDELTRTMAIKETLQLEEPLETLLSRVLEQAGTETYNVKDLCSGSQVPETTLCKLLNHSNRLVALAAALGEWLACPEGKVQAAIAEPWRCAILRSAEINFSDEPNRDLEYWLQGVLRVDSDLAVEWIRRKLEEGTRWIILERGPFFAALSGLDSESRRRLIEVCRQLDLTTYPRGFLRLLIRRTPGLYEELLRQVRLEPLRQLEPLEGLPDDSWPTLVEVAARSDSNFSAAEMARGTYSNSFSFVGSESAYWTKWAEAFAVFEDHPSDIVQQTTQEGLRIAQERIETAKEREHRQELIGLLAAR